MPVWQHTDEDGDQVRLVETNHHGLYSLVVNEGDTHAVVNVDEDALFRLRDVIEKISTS
jgi:hypothetical protein